MPYFTNDFNTENDKQSFLKTIAIISVVIGLFIIFITFMQTTKGWGLSSSFSTIEFNNWDYKAKIGDFIGGIVGTIFSLSGFFLLYLTFQKQKETAFKTGVETRFYQMIGLHKSNVNEMEFSGPNSKYYKGRKVFDIIFDQIKDCYKDIAPFFSPIDSDETKIYQEDHLIRINKLTNTLNQIDSLQLAHIDIAYSIVFFGVSNDDVATLYRLHIKYYKEDFLKPLFTYIVRKPSKKSGASFKTWEELKSLRYDIAFGPEKQLENNKKKYENLIAIKPDGYIKYYGGHQYKLGHYFRHLYQQVKYIDKLSLYNYHDKYEMVKTMRAQLSSPEQYVIFFNSISFVGRAWEFESIIKGNNPDNRFISKYNFIKNVPELTLLVNNSQHLPINLKYYYPLVAFEFGNKPLGREIFEI